MWLKGLKDGVSAEVHCKSLTDTSAGVTLPFHFQVKMVRSIRMEEETLVIVLKKKKKKHSYRQTAMEAQLAMRQKAESFPTFAVL